MTSGDTQENPGRTNEGEKVYIDSLSSQKYQIEKKKSFRHYLVFASGDQTNSAHCLSGKMHHSERAHPSKAWLIPWLYLLLAIIFYFGSLMVFQKCG